MAEDTQIHSYPALAIREGPVVEAAKISSDGNSLPVVQNESIPVSNIEELGEALGIVSSLAGPVVNSRTSMQLSVVYACARLISGAMASMPLPIYRSEGEGRTKDSGHAVLPLLNLQPTPLMSAAMFWEFVTSSMLIEGDGFAVIMRDSLGDPVEFLPVNPTQVHVEQKNGRLLYVIYMDGVYRGFDQDDILHFAGFGFNGTRSLSVVKHAAIQSIGLAMAMEQFSADFFKSGAHQDVAIIKEGKWDKDDQENFRDAWARTYGGIQNRKKPLTIGKGLDIKQLSVNAEDSQLLGSREFENVNLCTAFGIPAWMVNQGNKLTAWGSGMAEVGLAFVRYTLTPHTNRFQQELNRKLFLRTPFFVEFNSAGLMRGTLKERNEAYKSALGGSNVPGYLAINEVRRIENYVRLENPIYDEPYDPRLVATPIKEPTNAE